MIEHPHIHIDMFIHNLHKDEYQEITLRFLQEYGIRYDKILFNMPMGERIVVNDRKSSGLDMAIAINVVRDIFPCRR